jgi:predicted XRE-type DNA-binding protein
MIEQYTQADGRRLFEEDRERFLADRENRILYQQEAAKKALWLQLVKARQASGLTQEQLAQRLGVSQSQVARLEKRGYDAYSLSSLRRYVQALGDGFSLEVIVHAPATANETQSVGATAATLSR